MADPQVPSRGPVQPPQGTVLDFGGPSASFDVEGAKKAGYSDEEIQSHLAEKAIRRSQPIVSEPFKERIATGNAFSRIFGKVADAAKDGIGEAPFGFQPDSDTTMFLQKIGVFGNPETGRPGMLLGAGETFGRPAAAVLDAFGRTIRSGAYSVGGLFGAVSEEMGASQGEANRLKRDLGSGLDFAAQIAPMLHMQMGAPGMSRTRRAPDGKVHDEPIGGLPTEQSFVDATHALIGDGGYRPELEMKLKELYSKHGWHPAEVFNDAKADPVLRGQLLSIGEELPEQLVPAAAQRAATPIAESTIADAQIPFRDLLKTGDQGTSPFMLADGRVVRTGGDHSSFLDKVGDVTQHTQADFGMVRMSYGDSMVNGQAVRTLTFDLIEGQQLTDKQIANLKRLANVKSEGQTEPNKVFVSIRKNAKWGEDAFDEEVARLQGTATDIDRLISEANAASKEPGIPALRKPTEPGKGGGEPPEPPGRPNPPEPEREPFRRTGTSDSVRLAEDAIAKHLSIGEDEPKRAWWSPARIYEATVDKLFPLKEAEKYAIDAGVDLAVNERPYVAARLYSGFAGKAEVMLKYEGPFNFFTYENVGPSLQKIWAPVQNELNSFRIFVASARAAELENRGIRTGFDMTAARTVVENAPTHYKAAMLQMVDYQNNVAAYLRDSGVLSRRGYAAMVEANKLYVPFHTVVDEAGLGISARGASLQPQNPVHRIKGADWKKIDPLESVIKNTFIMTAMAERNTVGTKLVNMFKAVDDIEGTLVRQPGRDLAIKQKYEGPVMIGKRRDELATASDHGEVGSLMEKKLRDYGFKDPPPDLTGMLESLARPLADNEIRVFENGRAVLYSVDPDVARAIKGLDQESMHWIFKVMGVPANLLKAGSVLEPSFWGRHLFRENFYATATYEHGVFTPADQMKGLAGWAVHDQDFINWLKGGGGHVSMVALDRNYLQENIRELTAKTGLMTRAWNVVGHPITAMRAATEVALSATHFGAFKKRMAELETATGTPPKPEATGPGISAPVEYDAPRLGQMHRANWMVKDHGRDLYLRDADSMKEGMKVFGYDPETGVFKDIPSRDATGKQKIVDAAWTSRDTSVDNSRIGSKMAVVNTISAFANAKVQDVAKGLFESAARNPGKYLAVAGVTMAAPSALLYAVAHDDPRYRDAPQWQKDIFWIVPTDKWEAARPDEAANRPHELVRINSLGQLEVNNGIVLRFPKPFSLGVIAASGTERLLEAWHRENPRAFQGYVNSLFEATIGDLVPNSLVPPVEQATNKSRFTGQTLIPGPLEKQLPEYQYTPYTTELSKKLGMLISEIPGVHDLTTPRDRNVFQGTAAAASSPMLIENLVRGWSGNLGLYALQTADAALRKAGVIPDPPKAAGSLADVPFIRSFVVRYPTASPQVIQDLYDGVGEMRRLRDTFQAQVKQGNVDAMDRLIALDGGGFLMRADTATQALANMTKIINMVNIDPKMPPSEKRQMIDGLYFGMQQIAKAELAALDAVRKTMKETKP